MLLLAVFGVVALTLAIVGVYGVVSYVVAQRTREIGIRVALGARRGQVIRLVLWSAMRPVIAGIVVGGVGAVFASRLLGSLLFNVKPGDPTSWSRLPRCWRAPAPCVAGPRRARDTRRSDHRVEGRVGRIFRFALPGSLDGRRNHGTGSAPSRPPACRRRPSTP